MAEKEFLNVRFKQKVHLANKQSSRLFCFRAKVITAQKETAIKEEANWIGLICVRALVCSLIRNVAPSPRGGGSQAARLNGDREGEKIWMKEDCYCVH